jgi:putative ABC transport system permease protein
MLDRLGAVPGVTAAAAMSGLPLLDGEPVRKFTVTGRAADRPSDAPWAVEAATAGDYGRAIGLPLLDGRTWQPGDRAAAWAVALVNREAVRRYWPSRSPVGERITMLDARGQADGQPIEIIGVVDNVIGAEPTEPPPPRVYRPLQQLQDRSLTSVAFIVRAVGDTAAVAPAVRAAMRAEDRDLAVSEVRTFGSQVANSLRENNLIMALFASFAVIGLIVAVTGVYGVTAFSVGQRRHEIGVRIALGATTGDVMRLIIGRTFRLIGIGAALGIAGGWAIGLAMRNILYGVGAADPVTYATVLGLVAFCGLVACHAPARRATRLDPMIALRTE